MTALPRTRAGEEPAGAIPELRDLARAEGRGAGRFRRVAGGSSRRFLKLAGRVAVFLPFGKRRVLLLEDDPSMQRLVARLVRQLRSRVEVFGNGRAVVARLAEKGARFDAILLDIMMPHDGGLTVLRDLRERHPAMLARVILLTASGVGITDPWLPFVFAVVAKPFDRAELVTTVRSCIAQGKGL